MPNRDLIPLALVWVIDNYEFNRHHLVKSLEWLDRIAPSSREAVRLAALTHDMERAFPDKESPLVVALDDPAYTAAHSARSARIVGEWLRENGAEDMLIRDVQELILAHETGGSAEANLVQAADSLSFLDANIDLFLGFARSGRYSPELVRLKFDYSYDRIQVPHARALALPLYREAIARLDTLLDDLRRAGA